MKTVRMVGQGIPVRLSDDVAYQIVVVDKDGEYCPKSVYKDYKKSTSTLAAKS